MEEVTVICDRCGVTIHSFLHPDYPEVTAGFYDTREGHWAWFAEPEENIVCDRCMHADERYKATYGNTEWK